MPFRLFFFAILRTISLCREAYSPVKEIFSDVNEILVFEFRFPEFNDLLNHKQI